MVSVIIPVYNVEKYIHECLDSVIGQTYQDLEIIIVDDGSPDHCGEICDDYATQDARIRVIHKKNGGLSDARNAGLEIAGGEYVYFLDSDDYIKPNAIQALVHCAEKEHADLVYFDADTLLDGFDIPGYYETFIRSHKYRTDKGTMVHLQHLRNKEYFSVVQLLFLRRSFLETHRLRFRKGIIHEDELFTPVAFMKAQRAAYLNQSLYVRRLRAGSIMSGNISVPSLKGNCVCVKEYAKMFCLFPKGSIERKILLYHLQDKSDAVLNIYCNLGKDQLENAKTAFRQTMQIVAQFSYFNDLKRKVKYHHANIYRLYVRYLRTYKDQLLEELKSLKNVKTV